jgi:hypothetical protein
LASILQEQNESLHLQTEPTTTQAIPLKKNLPQIANAFQQKAAAEHLKEGTESLQQMTQKSYSLNSRIKKWIFNN